VQISTKASFFEMFRSELKDFRGGVNKLRQDTHYEGLVGKHDDLILSVAQSIWFSEQFIRPPEKSFEVPTKAICYGDDMLDKANAALGFIPGQDDEQEARGSWLPAGRGYIRMRY
jgi:hypothetical protein